MSATYILQEIISEDLPFRVHNIKVTKFICQKDLPMMFLEHYDALPEDIKALKPLQDYRTHAFDVMSATHACALLGLPAGTVKPATHIKISGTLVIVLDDFPLALHLHFTNTTKDSQAYRGDDIATIIQTEVNKISFAGNVNVLHKDNTKNLISISHDENEYLINPSDSYTLLPNAHALTTTHTINTLIGNHPQALNRLAHTISEKLMAYYQENF